MNEKRTTKGYKNSSLPRISPTFLPEDYEEIRLIAEKENKPMAELVRDWALQGKNGILTEKNIDVLVPIIREQLNSILAPQMERIATLSAKTCVQAGAAAYLCAETINKFVQPAEREEVQDVYTKARKKSVQYLKSRDNILKEDNE